MAIPRPPKTLTRAEFAKTLAAKKPKASYQKYLGYVGRRRPARMAAREAAAAAANDPLNPLTEAQIRQRATSDIRSQVDPLVAEINRTIGARTKAGMGAIGGYTEQLAGKLGQYQGSAANIYGQAQASQAGSDAALAGMLGGQGDEIAKALASKLGAAGLGQPIIDKTTGQVQQTGAGSAGALYGQGSAALSQLIAQGAGAQDYAAKLPGIARLGGLQQAGDLQRQAGRDLSEQTGAITSQIPGAVTSTIGKYRADELDKGLARSANETKVGEAQAAALADIAQAEAKAREATAKRDQSFEILRLNHQHAMALARAKFTNSAQSATDARAFKAEQDRLSRRFTARQKELDRKARADVAAANRAAKGTGAKPKKKLVP